MSPVSNLEELRLIPRQWISELGNILQIENEWRDVMGLIPSFPWIPENDIPSGYNYSRKYTSEDIRSVFPKKI